MIAGIKNLKNRAPPDTFLQPQNFQNFMDTPHEFWKKYIIKAMTPYSE